MSELIHVDSGDHYDQSGAYTKWFSAPTVVSGGRTSKGWRGGSKVFTAVANNTFGFARKGYPRTIFTLENIPVTLGFNLILLADSRLYATFGYYGDIDTSALSPVTVVRDNWWAYYELQTVYSVIYEEEPLWHYKHQVAFSLKINEEVVLSDTIAWNRPTAEPGFTKCTFDAASSSVFDDYYMSDSEFLGDVRIYVIRPNAAGDLSQWISASGGANYLEVKDQNIDFDASYIYTDNVGDITLVNLEDINYFGAIKGVQFNAVCEKTDAGGAVFHSYNKINGTYYENTTDIHPSYENWLDRTVAYRLNPATSADFTNAEVNAMQAGVKRTT